MKSVRIAGGCCGPVPASEEEAKAIRKFIAGLPGSVRRRIRSVDTIRALVMLECKFRDDKAQKCLIYPVRPVVCKLFGVDDRLRCINGNSAFIDGRELIPAQKSCTMLNDIEV